MPADSGTQLRAPPSCAIPATTEGGGDAGRLSTCKGTIFLRFPPPFHIFSRRRPLFFRPRPRASAHTNASPTPSARLPPALPPHTAHRREGLPDAAQRPSQSATKAFANDRPQTHDTSPPPHGRHDGAPPRRRAATAAGRMACRPRHRRGKEAPLQRPFRVAAAVHHFFPAPSRAAGCRMPCGENITCGSRRSRRGCPPRSGRPR